uniref:DUF4435 domain-containing protein n=1 Tax=Globodera pallida TaxID=36090 RepID=A0A183CDI6_GLOPA
MSMDINNMKIFELVGAHFNGYSRLIDYKKKKNPSASKFEASLKGEYFCLSNFLLNLLNRTLNLPNLKKYFVNTDLSKELSEKLKAKQSETGKFYDYHFKRYNQEDVESWKDKIVEHEHYLHFEEAIHINWNPNKEMFILIQLLKYRCFCPTRLYYFVDRFNKNLGEELRNDCLKMRESYELDGKILYSSEQIIAGDKQNKLLKHLETLENFGQIEKAYEKLKMFFKS